MFVLAMSQLTQQFRGDFFVDFFAVYVLVSELYCLIFELFDKHSQFA